MSKTAMQCEPYIDIVRQLFQAMDAEAVHQRALDMHHRTVIGGT